MSYIRRSYSGRGPDRVQVLDITLFQADSCTADSAQPKRLLVMAAQLSGIVKTSRKPWFFQADSLNISQNYSQDIAQPF